MEDNKKHDDELDTNRVTPRDVPSDRQQGAGTRDRSTGDDRSSGRSVRRDTEAVEAPGGDQAGVAGGGIDSDVSGLGGGKP